MSGNNDVALLELDAAASMQLLKKMIIDANPQLTDPTVDPVAAMNMIRRWVAANIPLGQTTDIWSKTILHHVVACLTGRGAVMCGGHSHILGYVYCLFGLKAAVYNYGITGVHTHVVTLVTDGAVDPFVQDGLFNATYAHVDGTPMRFSEMCELLKAGRGADIVRLVDKGEKLVAKTNFNLFGKLPVHTEDMVEFERRNEGHAREQVEKSPLAKEWCLRRGLPINPIYLFLSRIGIAKPRGPFGPDRCDENTICLVENNTFPSESSPTDS